MPASPFCAELICARLLETMEVEMRRRRAALGLPQQARRRLADVHRAFFVSPFCAASAAHGRSQCSDYEGSQLASFVPPPIDASPPLPEATLTVFPSGHEYFDHILISALIVERKMTLSA